MTLVTTEISLSAPALIVMAADRRITRDGQFVADRRKLFRLPGGRRGGVSYFGLAEVRLATRSLWMDEWLTDFLNRSTGLVLSDTATELEAALNATPSLNRRSRSGFQLAGIGADERPEFWYVRNIDDAGEPTLGRWEAREDFQRRDAPRLTNGAIHVYRNGDLTAHEAAWQALDLSLGRLRFVPGFREPTTSRDRMEWTRFKLDTVAAFYERFATPAAIIGRPVDAMAITAAEVIGPVPG